MGKGKKLNTANTLSFSRSMLENVLFVSPQQPDTVINKPADKDNHRWKFIQKKSYKDFKQKIESVPFYIFVCSYLNLFLLIIFGHLRDILGKIFKPNQYAHLKMSKVIIFLNITLFKVFSTYLLTEKNI